MLKKFFILFLIIIRLLSTKTIEYRVLIQFKTFLNDFDKLKLITLFSKSPSYYVKLQPFFFINLFIINERYKNIKNMLKNSFKTV